MKRLLLSIMVMAVLASCGKDNKVNSDLAGTAAVSPYTYNTTNSVLAGNAAAQELIAKVNNPATFGNGIPAGAASGVTWNTLIAQYPSTVFLYTNGTVRNSDITVAQKQTQIMGLLNSAQTVTQDAQGIYFITVSGAIYAVDSRYALQMNPSAVRSAQGDIYFVRAM